jgi:hypothetical protein
MRTGGTGLRAAVTLAAIVAVTMPAGIASADPDPAGPAGSTPVPAAEGPPGPPGAPDPAGPPADGAPVVDDGKVVSAPPATMTANDGTTLTVSASDEVQMPVAPLTTAISTRDYDVGGVFRGSVTKSSEPPKGIFEVGYQIGCGVDMGTGPGVLIGGNLGGNAAIGLIDGRAFLIEPPMPGSSGLIPAPNAGITGGGSVTVSLKPGIVNTVPVTKKPFKGEAPRVSIRNFRMRIDGCVGESFIRSYATFTSSTDNTDDVVTYLGPTKAV